MINKRDSTCGGLLYMALGYGTLGGLSLSLALKWVTASADVSAMVFYCVMSVGSLTVAGLLALRSWRNFQQAAETEEGE